MPRMAGIVIPGQPHHVVQRGHNRQDVFFVDDDRRAHHHPGSSQDGPRGGPYVTRKNRFLTGAALKEGGWPMSFGQYVFSVLRAVD